MKSDHITSPGSDFAPIDRSILHILEEDVADNDPDIMLEFINIYLHDSEEHIDEIAKQMGSKEYRKIEISAHSLKSSSATFGAMALSALSDQIEQLARARKSDGIAEILHSVRAEFARVKAALVVEREKWTEAASR
ncbi:MAG: Hpt domain-containing protein [Chloroflexi bacterium]|nr:Hpt domain-containing protein [Chloroflexota bacterium]